MTKSTIRVLALVLFVPTSVAAQSLAEVARRARALREQQPPVRVYTNADLPNEGARSADRQVRPSPYRALLESARARQHAELEIRLLRQQIAAARPGPAATDGAAAAGRFDPGIPLVYAYGGFPFGGYTSGLPQARGRRVARHGSRQDAASIRVETPEPVERRPRATSGIEASSRPLRVTPAGIRVR